MKKNTLYSTSAMMLCYCGIISTAGLHLQNDSSAQIKFVLQLTNNEVRTKELEPGQSTKVDAFFEGFKTLKIIRFNRNRIGMSITDIDLNIPWNTTWSQINFGETKITGTLNQTQGKQRPLQKNYGK